jgi:hypothetical protein
VPVGDVESWLAESRAVAETTAYSPEVLAFLRSLPPARDAETPTLTLSAEYLKAGERASALRLNAAGTRLARLVEQLSD